LFSKDSPVHSSRTVKGQDNLSISQYPDRHKALIVRRYRTPSA
jgi:hypothetical protein